MPLVMYRFQLKSIEVSNIYKGASSTQSGRICNAEFAALHSWLISTDARHHHDCGLHHLHGLHGRHGLHFFMAFMAFIAFMADFFFITFMAFIAFMAAFFFIPFGAAFMAFMAAFFFMT